MRADDRFVSFYREERPRVFRMTYAFCGDRETAEDATQEAFARALERWHRLADEPWRGRWLATTALNAARRMSRRRRPPVRSRDAVDPPHDAADLWAVVRALPRRQREAIVLHYGADLRIPDVAVVMRCREGTVKAHLSKARETLRATLEAANE